MKQVILFRYLMAIRAKNIRDALLLQQPELWHSNLLKK